MATSLIKTRNAYSSGSGNREEHMCIVGSGYDIAGNLAGSTPVQDVTQQLRYKVVKFASSQSQWVELNFATRAVTGLEANNGDRVSLFWWDDYTVVDPALYQVRAWDPVNQDYHFACCDLEYQDGALVWENGVTQGYDWLVDVPGEINGGIPSAVAFVNGIVQDICINWAMDSKWVIGRPVRVIVAPRYLLVPSSVQYSGDPPTPRTYAGYALPTEFWWERDLAGRNISVWAGQV